MVRRNRISRSTRRRRLARRVRRIPRSCFNGVKARGPFDPRQVNLNPWNTAIIEGFIADTGADKNFAYSSADLYARAATQLGISASQLQIRIHKIDVWDRERDVEAYFYDYTTNQSLARLKDRGTWDRPSHVHFILPRTTSSHILANSKDIGIVSGRSINYIHTPISNQPDMVILQITVSYRLNPISQLVFFPLKMVASKPSLAQNQMTAVKSKNSDQSNNIQKTPADSSQ